MKSLVCTVLLLLFVFCGTAQSVMTFPVKCFDLPLTFHITEGIEDLKAFEVSSPKTGDPLCLRLLVIGKSGGKLLLSQVDIGYEILYVCLHYNVSLLSSSDHVKIRIFYQNRSVHVELKIKQDGIPTI